MRLIPARAGNTSEALNRTTLASAHPRSRGEHFGVDTVQFGAPGSSPLARGTLLLAGLGLARGRLIPARAGNTAEASLSAIPNSAHPRSRGEHTC